jgi:precorrin-6B methylase 2
MYAEHLRNTFPELDPEVADLFLLEAHQIAALPERAPDRELAAVLHAEPGLHRFFVSRHPPIEEFLARLLAEHGPADTAGLADCERTLVWEIADWIVYQRAPGLLDRRADGSFDPEILTELVDLDGKVVIDAGAGTGGLSFAACPLARHVFAVEPATTLRSYMREKVGRLEVPNLFVLDGFLHAIPLPDGTADVLLTRRAIGWHLPEELAEIDRVVRPGGTALHLFGQAVSEETGADLARVLDTHGYRQGTYPEPDGPATLFRKVIPT